MKTPRQQLNYGPLASLGGPDASAIMADCIALKARDKNLISMQLVIDALTREPGERSRFQNYLAAAWKKLCENDPSPFRRRPALDDSQ